MKNNINLIIFFSFLTLIFSCERCDKSATLTVKNELDNVVLKSVRWNGRSIAEELLPGQNGEITLYPTTTDFPSSEFLYFQMNALNRVVALRTVDLIVLDRRDNITIQIDSSLQVTTF